MLRCIFGIFLLVHVLPEILEQPLEVAVCARANGPAMGLSNGNVIEGVHFINARFDRVWKLRHEVELHIATVLILKIAHSCDALLFTHDFVVLGGKHSKGLQG